MDTLFNCLSALSDRPLGTVVHIGAGGGSVLQSYARLSPTRTVLIEGDPTAASELQRSASGHPGISVRPLVVGGTGGTVAWNRFNLPALNGPLDAEALSACYPRLRLIEQLDVQVVSLDQALGDIEVASDGDGLTVLVLDVPGQECSLLKELPEPRLQAFDAVLLRGCREVLAPWGRSAPDAVALLQERCFDALVSDAETEPLWPATLLRFNRSRHDTQHLRARLEVLEATLDASQKAAAEQTRLAAERQAQLEALMAGKAAAEKLASERAAQIEQLGQAKAAAEKSAAERATQIQQLTQARDEQATAAAEQTRLAAERQTQLGERQARIDALGKEKTQAIAERDALAKEKVTLVAARDEQTKLAREAIQRKLSLEAELAELGARYGLLQEELIKGEAQIELIADLLLRDPRA